VLANFAAVKVQIEEDIERMTQKLDMKLQQEIADIKKDKVKGLDLLYQQAEKLLADSQYVRLCLQLV
jgi:hypothetical protein